MTDIHILHRSGNLVDSKILLLTLTHLPTKLSHTRKSTSQLNKLIRNSLLKSAPKTNQPWFVPHPPKYSKAIETQKLLPTFNSVRGRREIRQASVNPSSLLNRAAMQELVASSSDASTTNNRGHQTFDIHTRKGIWAKICSCFRALHNKSVPVTVKPIKCLSKAFQGLRAV